MADGLSGPGGHLGSCYNVIAAGLAKRAKKTYTVEDLAAGDGEAANGATLMVEASCGAVNNGRPRK